MSHDLPVVVVAPRPVHLSFARPTRILSTPVQPLSSPCPSPLSARSALSSEALEEFLSILRPSFFPSSSPTLGKARRSLSIPNFQYDRPISFRPRQQLEIPKSDGADFSEHNATSSAPDSSMDTDCTANNNDSREQDGFNARWLPYGSLASPISRMHTRNPFLKLTSDNVNPLAPIPHLSPAAVPLPLPTPDEMTEML